MASSSSSSSSSISSSAGTSTGIDPNHVPLKRKMEDAAAIEIIRNTDEEEKEHQRGVKRQRIVEHDVVIGQNSNTPDEEKKETEEKEQEPVTVSQRRGIDDHWELQRFLFTCQLLDGLLRREGEGGAILFVRYAVRCFELDSKLPIHQSWIDLNELGNPKLVWIQVSGFDRRVPRPARYIWKDGRRDTLRCLLELREITKHDKESIRMFRTRIWPRVVALLQMFPYDHVEEEDDEQRTPLNLLCFVCRTHTPDDATDTELRLAERLLEIGSDVNSRDRDGSTPLLSLCECDDDPPRPSFFNLLLRYGADVNATSKDGETFLHILVRNQHFHIIQQLYTDAPQFMSAFDYALRNKWRKTAMEVAKRMPNKAESSILKQTFKEMYQLMQHHRNQQREQLASALLYHTSIAADLLDRIILPYLYAECDDEEWTDE